MNNKNNHTPFRSVVFKATSLQDSLNMKTIRYKFVCILAIGLLLAGSTASFADVDFFQSKVTRVEWTMPDVCHTFRAGHRIMVQVQSSWFPLMDRNPQIFCDIYHAKPEDYRKATQRIYRSPDFASKINVMVLGGE